MNLPNYFLADLPPEASLTPAMIAEACQALKRNRQQYLAHRPVHSLITLLTDVAKQWLEPEFPFRKFALAEGPAATGFSRPTLAAGLDSFFKELTPAAFHSLLEQDLGQTERIEQFVSTPGEQKANRSAMALAPELLVHVAPGNLPNPALTSIVLGVLTRSAQFVKCARGAAWLPRLFAHSLYHADPKLGACLELADWPGGNRDLEGALFEQAGCITATGSDETLAHLRARVPSKVRFVGYGFRVSFGYVAQEMLSGLHTRRVGERAAKDIVAWNQLGCLSPHVLYVQKGGSLTAEHFAEVLAEVLAEHESSEPRGNLPVEAAAAIASRRSFYELRAAHSPETRIWASKDSTAWTVVYEADPLFQLSCLNRFIYIKEVKDLSDALQAADTVRGKVSTVGVAVPEHKTQEIATELARWGATRVCPLGRMQHPPLAWRHDGRPALGDLVTWTDWEQ